MSEEYILIVRVGPDRFAFGVPDMIREVVVIMANQIAGGLEGDDPSFQRLFPTAYPDDAEKDAGYQVLARSELIDERYTAIETVRRTLTQDELNGEELDAWMRVVNDIRLVQGTFLEISEDEDWEPDEDDEGRFVVYEWLGVFLQGIVEAQMRPFQDPAAAGDVSGDDGDR